VRGGARGGRGRILVDARGRQAPRVHEDGAALLVALGRVHVGKRAALVERGREEINTRA